MEDYLTEYANDVPTEDGGAIKEGAVMERLSDTEMAVKRACLRSYEIEILSGDPDPAIVTAYREIREELRVRGKPCNY